MTKHVTQFISQCPTCQKQNVRKVAYNTIPFVTSSSRPHERINVDTFQVSTEDSQGNKAVVVVVDTCTRWTELYPVPSWEQEFYGISTTFRSIWPTSRDSDGSRFRIFKLNHYSVSKISVGHTDEHTYRSFI